MQTHTPRPGSRAARLAAMAPGESALFEAAPGRARQLAQQLGSEARKAGWPAPIQTQQLIAVHPQSRAVLDVVRLTRGGGQPCA